MSTEYHSLINKQQQYFHTGATLSCDFRLMQLTKLYDAIKTNNQVLLNALQKDMGKPYFEGFAFEVGFTLTSISHMKKHLKRSMKDEKVTTPIHQAGAKSWIRKEPYGTVLIIGAFNYPFRLLFVPMIGAIAAGNTVILKPSEKSSHVEKAIVRLIKDTFEDRYITTVTGGKDTVQSLFEEAFDYAFFTGSKHVGKVIMKSASKNLIPLTLELGGKCPAIIDRTANLKMAAKRIAWGKFINAGQSCVAPDYVYIHEEVASTFKRLMVKTIKQFYGHDACKNDDFGQIVDLHSFHRLKSLIQPHKIYHGGTMDENQRYIEPTLMDNVDWDDPVMQQEIFGPILPILTYHDNRELNITLKRQPKPLALYIFSENQKFINSLLDRVQSGGVSINDTTLHLSNLELPFGGVGSSGMGMYQGIYSFNTFSHRRGVLKKTTRFDLNIVFPPYKNRLRLLRWILK